MQFLFFLCVFLGLSACTEESALEKMLTSTPTAKRSANPVIVLCGENCKRCHRSAKKCLKILKENLVKICQLRKENCYTLWLEYASECNKSCRPIENIK